MAHSRTQVLYRAWKAECRHPGSRGKCRHGRVDMDLYVAAGRAAPMRQWKLVHAYLKRDHAPTMQPSDTDMKARVPTLTTHASRYPWPRWPRRDGSPLARGVRGVRHLINLGRQHTRSWLGLGHMPTYCKPWRACNVTMRNSQARTLPLKQKLDGVRTP